MKKLITVILIVCLVAAAAVGFAERPQSGLSADFPQQGPMNEIGDIDLNVPAGADPDVLVTEGEYVSKTAFRRKAGRRNRRSRIRPPAGWIMRRCTAAISRKMPFCASATAKSAGVTISTFSSRSADRLRTISTVFRPIMGWTTAGRTPWRTETTRPLRKWPWRAA